MSTVTESRRQTLQLSTKPDMDKALDRIYGWYECEVIDRPPVRFAAHNSQYNTGNTSIRTPEQWKERWFDTEQVIDRFVQSIQNRRFLGETFPIYWPNLGPDVYAAFYGCELSYDAVTSWSHPFITDPERIDDLQIDSVGEYYQQLEKMTSYALEVCRNDFLVGYTDLHPGVDCVVAWRGVEELCFDLMDEPEQVERMVDKAGRDFAELFSRFHETLERNGQFSVNWMEVPTLERMHVPSCDFATMMSPAQFEKFAMPAIQQETQCARYNIFHMDGKGVARHVDRLLELPEITAIQWVQGVGEDRPILQWLDLIRKIQAAGKAVIVDLQKNELDEFIDQMRPEGLFLWIAEDNEEEQMRIIRRLEQWT